MDKRTAGAPSNAHSAGRILTLVLVGLTIAHAGPASAQQLPLLITTESAPALSMSSNGGRTVYGLAADKVHEMMHRAQIPYRIEIMSWNRAFELARGRENVCVFSTARTPEREPQFSWIGPIAKGEWVIVGSTRQLGKVSGLDQLKSSQIGANLGDAVSEYLTQRGYHVANSYEDATTIKNLLLGRLDYWASESHEATAEINKQRLNQKLAVLFTFSSSDLYLACNPGVSAVLINKMRDKLREMKVDGTVATIDAKY